MPFLGKLLILTDYRNQFWLKSDYKEQNFDVKLLCELFKSFGFEAHIKQFNELDFKNEFYKDVYVIYQSTEDPESFYKSFIEDCLLGLKLQGAILIPGFKYFRSHNNKVFMEILRDVHGLEILKKPLSEYFGSFEDYQNRFEFDKVKPKVFKLAEGAQSKNVFLLQNAKDFLSIPKKKSRSFNFYYWLVDQIKPLLKKQYPNYIKKSHHRKKFIVQDFISDLEGDYKILVYNKNYYVLKRGVKSNDFRASGSGLFEYDEELPSGLLDYAKKCFQTFDVPFMGMDIAEKDGEFFLIEFQFVHFGNYTLEKSPFHFQLFGNEWKIIKEKVVLEEEFANSVHHFITNKK